MRHLYAVPMVGSMPPSPARRARERHLDWCRARNLRASTIYARERVLVRLCRSVGDILDATPASLEVWYADITRRMLPESRAVELSHVREFYKWAVRDGLLTSDPTLHLPRPRIPTKLPNPIPQDDLEHALSCAPDRIRPWLYLAAFAGLRCFEIAALRADNVRLRDTPPVILLNDTKGGGMEAVDVVPVLGQVLAPLPTRGWLFPRHDGRPGHATANLVSQLGNRYLHSLDIAHTMHSLRHWYGTNFYKVSGRDLIQTKGAMRHKSLGSTQRYVWVDSGERSAIARRLPGAEGPSSAAG